MGYSVWLGTSYRSGPSAGDSVDELVLELQVSRSCPEMGINVVGQMRTYAGNMRPICLSPRNNMYSALYQACRVRPIRKSDDAKGFSVHTIYHIGDVLLVSTSTPCARVLWRVDTKAHNPATKALV